MFAGNSSKAFASLASHKDLVERLSSLESQNRAERKSDNQEDINESLPRSFSSTKRNPTTSSTVDRAINGA